MSLLEFGRTIANVIGEIRSSSALKREARAQIERFPVGPQLEILDRIASASGISLQTVEVEWPSCIYVGRRWDIKRLGYAGNALTPGMERREVHFISDPHIGIFLSISNKNGHMGFKSFEAVYNERKAEGSKPLDQLTDEERMQFCFDNAEVITGPIEEWDSGHY
jgi:hypothetical protein